MTAHERRSALVGLALLGAILVSYALVFDVRNTESTGEPLYLLLGLAYITGYTRIVLPRRQGVTTFNIREASYSLALIGGEPRYIIPVLLLFRLHQWWLTGVNTKWRLLTVATGLETILIQIWLFDYLDVLAQPSNVDFSTVAVAAPVLAAGSLVSYLVFSLVHPSRTVLETARSVPLNVIAGVCGMSWFASMLGLVFYVPENSLNYARVADIGPLLLLALAAVVTLQQFNRSQHWAQASRVLSDWRMETEQVRQVVKQLHRLGPAASLTLLIEDRTTGTTLRTWTTHFGWVSQVERLPMTLREALDGYPESGTVARRSSPWNLPRASGWMTSDTDHQRVALIQVSPAVRVNLLPTVPHAAHTDVPLPVESLLESLSASIHQYEIAGLSTTPGLANMLRHLTEGFAVSTDGRISSWNLALARLTGVSEEEAIGTSLHDHVRPSSIRVGDRESSLMTATRADGSSVYLQTTMSVISTDFQRDVIYAFRDVTETVASAESRSQFFAYVAHELKSPVTALYMQSDELEERLGEDDELVESVRFAVDQLSSHLADMATASELHLARSSLPTASHQLQASEILDFPWLVTTQRLHPRVRTQEATDFEGIVDVFRSHQIITNLVTNALKYSPEGTPVVLEYGVGHQACTHGYFRVIDKGPGIPAEILDGLFQPYFRGPNSHNTPGSGLGLALSRNLARQMGGDLTYEPGPDGGSVFSLWVPLSTPSLEPEYEVPGEAYPHT